MKDVSKQFFIAVLALLFPISIAYAADADPVTFQVIQGKMALDSTTVESAKVVSETNGDTVDIMVKLKPDAVQKFGDLTEEGAGKEAVITVDNRIVSKLTVTGRQGGEFLVQGLTKKQAKNYLKSLE